MLIEYDIIIMIDVDTIGIVYCCCCAVESGTIGSGSEGEGAARHGFWVDL